MDGARRRSTRQHALNGIDLVAHPDHLGRPLLQLFLVENLSSGKLLTETAVRQNLDKQFNIHTYMCGCSYVNATTTSSHICAIICREAVEGGNSLSVIIPNLLGDDRIIRTIDQVYNRTMWPGFRVANIAKRVKVCE